MVLGGSKVEGRAVARDIGVVDLAAGGILAAARMPHRPPPKYTVPPSEAGLSTWCTVGLPEGEAGRLLHSVHVVFKRERNSQALEFREPRILPQS